MTAFDTDILSDSAKKVPAVVARAAAFPVGQRFVPVVAAEEVFRGQLNTIRQAQTGGGPALGQAYVYFADARVAVRAMPLLPYTTVAHSLFPAWRAAKIRIGTQDLRIAATCLAHGATLVTRNARDYAQVPGLTLDVWA